MFLLFSEEHEKNRSDADCVRLQEEGKTEQARKDLGEGLRAILSTIFTFGAHDYDDISHYIYFKIQHINQRL